MINFIKDWANQIILAVIIATIFEMILPNGNNKKYIKMILGLYVLFTIIHPVITKITGNSADISNFDYKKYFDDTILETNTENFEDNNSKLIKQAYIDNIKKDIESKLEQRQYKVISCSVDVIDNGNKDTYGAIQSIDLELKKILNNANENISTIKVETVDINISNNLNLDNSKRLNLTDDEKKEIIEFLSQEYSIEKTAILIN